MIELHQNEQVIAAVRKHWFVFFLESIGLIVAAAAPVILAPLLFSYIPDTYRALVPAGELGALAVFAAACWLLLIATILAIAFTNYYLDVLIVTSARLIDVDQLGLFARDVAEVPIANIEDVKVETLGVFGHLLNFGNLHVQAASTKNEIIIRGLRNAEHVKGQILAAHVGAGKSATS